MALNFSAFEKKDKLSPSSFNFSAFNGGAKSADNLNLSAFDVKPSTPPKPAPTPVPESERRFDVIPSLLSPIETRTETSTPSTIKTSAFDRLKKIGEGVLSLGIGLGRGLLRPKETAQQVTEGFVTGTPRAVGGLQTGLSRAIEKGGEITAKIAETFNLPGQLAEFVTQGRIPAPEMNTILTQQIAESLNERAEENRKLSNILLQDGFVVEDERTLNEKLRDPQFLFRDLIGMNAPSLAISLGAGVATAPQGGVGAGVVATFGTSALLEGGFAINEARDFLESVEDPNLKTLLEDEDFTDKIGLIVGITNGFLETIPITRLLNRTVIGRNIRKNIIKDVVVNSLKQAGVEGGTESVQEIVSNSVAKIYDENRDVFEGVIEAGIAGGLLGGGVGVGTEVVAGGRQLYSELSPQERQGGFVRIPFGEDIPPELQPLVEEARKYKSAEEFVKAQGTSNLYNVGDSFEMGKIIENPFKEGLPSAKKVQEINRYLQANKDKYNPKYVKFYHGTAKGLPIEEKGLLPTSTTRRKSYQSESGYVYLANTPERAKTFGDLGNMSNSDVYEVVVPVNKLLPDLDQLNNLRSTGEKIGNTLGDSIVYGGGVRIKGKIEPYAVRKLPENTKTKSQLTDIWERANQVSITEDTLVSEQARQVQEDVERAFAEVEAYLDTSRPGGTLIQTEEGYIREKGIYPPFLPQEFHSMKDIRTASELLNGKEPTSDRQRRIYKAMTDYVAESVGQERFTDFEYTRLLESMEAEQVAQRRKFAQDVVAQLKEKRKPLTPAEVRKQVKALTSQPATFIKRRETTILKEKIKNLARGYREGRAITKQEIQSVQEAVLGVIDQLPAKDRDKFRRTIKNIQTTEQLQKALPEIESRVDSLLESAEARRLRKEIRDNLKDTRTKKQSGKRKGQYTPEIQRVLDLFRQAVTMTQEQAEAKLFDNLKNAGDVIPSAEQAMENRILSMVLRLDSMGVSELTELNNEINSLIEEGRMLNELEKFNREGFNQMNREKAIDVITGGKGLPQGIKTTGIEEVSPETISERAKKFMKGLGKTIVGWRDIMDMLSANDKTSEPGQSFLSRFGDVLDQNNAEKRGNRIANQEIRNMAFQAFNITKDRQLIKKFEQDAKEVSLGIFKNAEGVDVDLKFTKAEARKRWMEMQDPSLAETFEIGMAYTPEIKLAIDSFLTVEDKVFARMQMDFYKEYYASVNEVYSDMYGADLPFNEFYSPIRREGIDRDSSQGMGEFLQELGVRKSLTTGSLKERVSNIRPIQKQSDTQVLEQHIAEMEHFKAWAYKFRDFNAVFGNGEVRAAIKTEFGTGMLAIIDSFMGDFARGGVQNAQNIGAIDRLRGNFTRAVLGVKPSIGIKQLTSMVAYAEKMPIKDFVRYSTEFFLNPIDNWKFMVESSELMKERGSSMERDIRVAMKSDVYSNFRTSPSLWNKLMLNVQFGDQGAIVSGGWAYYKYQRAQGKTHEQAIKAFEDFTSETQQSADLDQQSYWQRGGTFAKLFTMFLSSPNQYFRKEIGAVRNTLAGRGSVVQHAKTLMIYHFLLPMFFQWVSDFGRWNPDEQKRAAILGALNGWFIVGDGLDYLIRKGLGMRTFSSEIALYSIADDAGKAISRLTKDDISEEDFYEALRGFLGATGAIAGVPAKSALDMGAGGYNILSGEYAKGLAQIMGWSPYTSEQVFGGGSGNVGGVDFGFSSGSLQGISPVNFGF